MKFSDLKFEPHGVAKDIPKDSPTFDNWKDHTQARWKENEVEVSIIFGKMFYSNGIDTYEAMVLNGESEPEGYLSEQEVEDLINRVCKES